MVTPQSVGIHVHSVIFIHAFENKLLYFSPLRSHLSSVDLCNITAMYLIKSLWQSQESMGKSPELWCNSEAKFLATLRVNYLKKPSLHTWATEMNIVKTAVDWNK